MKRIIFVFAAALFMLAQVAQAGQIKIRFAHWAAPSHPVSQSVDHFKEGLEKESNGEFSVEHFPNNQLGSEDRVIDQVKRGTIQIAITGTLIKKDAPDITLVDTPFSVETWEQARAIYADNDKVNAILAPNYYQDTNVRIMGWAVNGFRVVSSVNPVHNMEELAKLKLRVPNNEMHVRLFQALGVTTVMMPMPEIYNALETKVVDGQENPYPTIKNAGFWEVQKGILETRHIFSPAAVLVNGRFFERLTAEQQALLTKWVEELVRHNWDVSEKDDQSAKEFMIEKGVTVVVPDAEFRKQMLARLTDFFAWHFGQFPASDAWMEYCNSKK